MRAPVWELRGPAAQLRPPAAGSRRALLSAWRPRQPGTPSGLSHGPHTGCSQPSGRNSVGVWLRRGHPCPESPDAPGEDPGRQQLQVAAALRFRSL